METFLIVVLVIVLLVSGTDLFIRKRREILYNFKMELNYYIAFLHCQLIKSNDLNGIGRINTKSIRKKLASAESLEEHLLEREKKLQTAIIFFSGEVLFGNAYTYLRKWRRAEKFINNDIEGDFQRNRNGKSK